GVTASRWFKEAELEDSAVQGYFIDELAIPFGRFRIPPKELQESLSQQILMLQAAAGAVDDAQLKLEDEFALRTGVFVGIGLDFNSTNFSYRWSIVNKAKSWAAQLGLGLNEAELAEWTQALRDAFCPPLTANRTVGALGGIVASRVAREFKVGGAGITISSEENSGLQALNAAMRSLQQGDLDRAIVGAVDLAGDIRMLLTGQTGRDAGFPSQSEGNIHGEGAAAVIVKRLDDALKDGDKIYAVIKEIEALPDGVNSDNSRELIESAQLDIGYTGATSGLASLVKHAVCLKQEALPDKAQYWLRNRADGPHRSELRSSSVDGACLRVLLEAYERPSGEDFQRVQTLGAAEEALFVLEAEQTQELAKQLSALQGVAASQETARIEKLACEWWKAYPPQTEKRLGLALLARSVSELQEQIKNYQEIIHKDVAPAFPGNRVFFNANPVGNQGESAFVFPGSGNHYPHMGRDISAQWPEILRQQDRQNQMLKGQYVPELLWNCPDAEEMNRHPREVLLGQVAYSTLMTDLLRGFGLSPQAAIGYSLGESSAFFAMRAWNSRDEMLQRVLESPLYTRDLAGQFLAAAKTWGFPEGKAADWIMAAVQSSAEEIRPLLEGRKHVYLLIVNSPASCVIGGERQAVMEFVDELGTHFHPISGVSAAHCEIVQEVEQAYRALHYFADTVTPEGLRFYSGGKQKAYALTADSAADAILAQALDTIDFPAVIQQAYQDGVRSFIEIGPGNSCSNMIDKILADQPHFAASACASNYEDTSTVLRLLGRLSAERIPLDLSPLYGRESEAVALQAEESTLKKVLRFPTGGQPFEIILPEKKRVFAAEKAEQKESRKATIHASPETAQLHPQTDSLLNAPHNQSAPLSPFVAAASAEMQQAPGNIAPSMPSNSQAEQISELIQGMTEVQNKKVQAHEEYFKLAQGLTQSYADQLAFQMSLIESMQGTGTAAESGFGGDLSVGKIPLLKKGGTDREPLPPFPEEGGAGISREAAPQSPVFMTREQCLEFAIGSIENVLGEKFAEIDSHPTRVRLPDEPLMLVDRILSVEGEPCSMTKGHVITEHDVLPSSWYLDCGRIPTCIAVESGQADLFLSGYLGIDRITKGLAVYRLLDATITFHDDLPLASDVIRHDIFIDEFFRQGKMYLFRFRFESTVNGKIFLTMTSGCAGFFSRKDLDEGKGLVFTKMDLQSIPGKISEDWHALTQIASESYSDAQLDALRRGDLSGCFGSQFVNLPLQNPCMLPGGRMKLVDRILSLDPQGGRYGLGQICGEADIHPDDWFLICHFVDDQVMPGTLMYECCLHTLRVLLMRMGWVGEQHEIAWQPVPGVAGQLKCRGQVIATTEKVVYEIAVKEIGYRPEPYVICDAVMSADGKSIVRMIDMSLRLSGMNKEKLEAIWGKTHPPALSLEKRGREKPPSLRKRRGPGDEFCRKTAIFDSGTIMAFSNGKPSEAFGERYRAFDEERRIARLPGPPYQFLDRITAVAGEQWVMTAPKMAEAQYDVPLNEWYFAANRHQVMPFSVLLEIVLQPCGWLAAYVGSALTSEVDLSFRNLGGKATQFSPIGPDVGTLTTVVNLTSVSNSGGMIIQHYNYTLTNAAGGALYQGSTYFGFFTHQALAHQVGLREVQPYQPDAEEVARGEGFPYPQEAPFPDTQMQMVDKIELYVADGGPQGLGFIRGTKRVNPGEWFFKAHFYQDPVWPGSLGLEAFLQLLKVAAVKRWGWQPGNCFESMAVNHPHEWTYRGQVIPKDREVTIQAVISAIDDSQRLLEAEGFLSVDGRIIYQMEHFTLRVR
ncbi:MAG: type I polyketide synthase, partial [bacterium]|nr:type I polyketide synthase [bacterium]